ncbi:N-acetyltransferase [Clostridia bacterium]|nr:N-acetyltransferase [Clostridia bacterium]
MEIRRVTVQDNFAAIGEIYASSWKAAYRGLVPQDYLDGLSGKRWSDTLANSKHDAFVVMEKDRYIGTSSVCAARDDRMSGWGEVVSIYLLPEYFGKGYAKPLFDFAVAALSDKGFEDIYLWVLEGNIRAQRFYEKNGFQKNGDGAALSIGGKKLTELRYTKHLS